MPSKERPLWQCPKCGERFVTANIWHSCGKFSLQTLFARSEPHVLSLFRKYARLVRRCGPVRVIPQKTRAVFQVRVRFAGCYPRKSHLLCAVALRRRLDNNPRIVKIEKFTPQFIGNYFRVYSEEDLDAEVQSWLWESYHVGAQK